jgi:integrase/recombinase XerD
MGKRKGDSVKYFTAQEREMFSKVIAAGGNIRDKMIFDLLFTTGMRIAELHSLTVGKIKTALQYDGQLEIIGKGNKPRAIPLPAAIAAQLEQFFSWKAENGERLHPNSPLFCNYKKGKLCRRTIQKLVKKYCRLAGIRELHCHSLRHSYGFTLSKAGVDLNVIAALMGHSSVSTTFIYTRPDMEMKKMAVERVFHGA